MTYSIYDEAILEAKLIRETAEDKVKEKIIEAMTPQIKEMVEKSLSGESSLDEEKKVSNRETLVESSSLKAPKRKLSEASKEPAYDEDLIADDIKTSIDYELVPESYKTLNKIFNKDSKESMLKRKLNKISNNVKKLNEAQEILLKENKNSSRFDYLFKKVRSELEIIKTNDILTSNKEILENFLKLNKELENMSRRQRRNDILNESIEDIFEMYSSDKKMPEGEHDMPEGESCESEEDKKPLPEADELDLDLPDMDKQDKSDDKMLAADEVVAALKDLVGELDLEDELGEMMSPEDEEQEEMPPEDKEQEEMPEEEMPADEMPADEEQEEMPEDDQVIEIDESMLRREIGKMRAIREGEAKAMASHFGGGKLDKELFVDVDDSFMNKLSESKKKIAKINQAAKKVVVENRALRSELAETQSKLQEMKNQLSEMNLFNAKLLYANKLMQNRDLTLAQQKKIVEGLDNATTMNEAKLLFESLSESLTAKKPVNESASRRILGSSSRAVSSAQTRINESSDLDRWATLAGIKK